jgi:hypothetical protein
MAEEKFRAVVWRDRKSIERKAFPTPLEKVGSVIGVVGPRIPESWYRDLLEGRSTDEAEIIHQLPKEVQSAAIAMRTSRNHYEEIRRSAMPTSKRRPTPFSAKMASGGPALSAKKPDSTWKRREPETEAPSTKPINR